MAKAISFSSFNAGMMKVIEGSLDCFEFMLSIYFRKEILGLKDAENAANWPRTNQRRLNRHPFLV